MKTNSPIRDKDKKPFQQDVRKKTWIDEDTRKYLRRKKLCFTCQEPWVPGHRCAGKAKAHYIEVYSDNDEDDYEQEATKELQVAEEESHQGDTPEGVIATLSGVPRFHTLRVRGVVQGHRVGVLIDGGATHNFIDSAWVAKRGIQTEKFEGFIVAVAGNSSMECNYWILKLNVTLGIYNMTNSFYVVNVADKNVVLGVQWIYSIGKYTTNDRSMEMEF